MKRQSTRKYLKRIIGEREQDEIDRTGRGAKRRERHRERDIHKQMAQADEPKAGH